jgi:hypothetical protein
MPGLSAEAVLAIWERAPVDDAVRRPLMLLAHAHPEMSEDTLLDMSIGERDWLLLELRRQMFGERLDGFAHCPHCGERLEFGIEVDELRAMADPGAMHRALEMNTDDISVRLRAPNSHDLVEIQRYGDSSQAARRLLECCIEHLEYRGKPLSPDELPDELLETIGERLSQRQGLADLALEIECSACGRGWAAPLDIANFLGHELNRYAGQLLDQVHALAAAYGWSEQAILAMHPQRRHAYLERLLT